MKNPFLSITFILLLLIIPILIIDLLVFLNTTEDSWNKINYGLYYNFIVLILVSVVIIISIFCFSLCCNKFIDICNGMILSSSIAAVLSIIIFMCLIWNQDPMYTIPIYKEYWSKWSIQYSLTLNNIIWYHFGEIIIRLWSLIVIISISFIITFICLSVIVWRNETKDGILIPSGVTGIGL